jgi:hypothetical protein
MESAMFDLPLNKATIKTVGTHQFYIFPKPLTHTNQRDRPPTYADPDLLTRYMGTGSNGSAKLLPGKVHSAANAMMSSLRRVGDRINDWSMKSAVVQSGFRPDDASQGSNYLRIIKQTIREKPDIFNELEFPSNLEVEAQSVLGRPGDARRTAFHQHLAAAPGWSAQLVARLFNIVDNVYAPRGANPHATGLVFDLDFTILVAGRERNLGADPALNDDALRSAAGMWLNQYSKTFGFDSYNTDKEIWHQEFRSPKEGAGSPQAIELLNCCGQGLEIVDEALQYSEQAIREALKRIP